MSLCFQVPRTRVVLQESQFLDEKVNLLLLNFSFNFPLLPSRYENTVGLTEVKAAQARVVECEKKFVENQELRREAQKMIGEVQKGIKVVKMMVVLMPWSPGLAP